MMPPNSQGQSEAQGQHATHLRKNRTKPIAMIEQYMSFLVFV